MPREFEVHDGSAVELAQAAAVLDWGVLVTEAQGGEDIYLVGQRSPAAAAALLREAADALDALGG